jgi:hypothetical protein
MDACQHRNVMMAIDRMIDSQPIRRPSTPPKKMRKPKLTEFEQFALKYQSYGGVSTEKLAKARLNARRKLDLLAKFVK